MIQTRAAKLLTCACSEEHLLLGRQIVDCCISRGKHVRIGERLQYIVSEESRAHGCQCLID